jgi:transposase
MEVRYDIIKPKSEERIMPETKYKIELSETEVAKLKEITQKGKSSARKIMHANILLKTNNRNDNDVISVREIAEILEISPNTVNAVKKTYSESGLEAALERKTRLTPANASKITGDFEAQAIATALSPAPQGRANWTLRLLAEHCMEKKYIVSISHTAIGEMLNSNEVKPHLSKYWCIPKENDAHFVAHMEDVLGIYQRAYNAKIPVICMDEKPVQLLDEVYERVGAKPLRTDPDTGLVKSGELEKIDYQYERCGVASIFIFCEPLKGWRYLRALETRTKGDFAMMIKEIGDTFYSDAEKIILISDNLNTHNISSFYEVYTPKTAYRLAQKFEFHHTPIHGSWLNIAECELSSLAIQALGNQRINSVGLLNEIISDWQSDRNSRQKGVNWQFTNDKARIKLHRLYPTPIFE